jgi:hypothetical protein
VNHARNDLTPPTVLKQASRHTNPENLPQNFSGTTDTRKFQKGPLAPSGLTTGETAEYLFSQSFPPLHRPSKLLDTARVDKVKAPTPTGCAGRVPSLTLPSRAGCPGSSTGGSAGEKGFRARVFCRNGKPLKTLFNRRKHRLQMTINYIYYQ